MTLVSSIIQKAFRETNLIPVGQSPTTNQQNEALDLLNSVVLSSVGNEIGDDFQDINIGGDFDQSTICSEFVPYGARLVLNLSANTELALDPIPFEGQRLSFIDAGNNLSTYSLTLDGNGRNIEGSTSLVLNTDGDSRQWLYRADIGNWVKITSLIISDEMPFPIEFDDYFITMLAMRLNPRYSQLMTQESLETLKRIRSQIRARYHNYKQIMSDLPPFGWLSQIRFATNFDTGL